MQSVQNVMHNWIVILADLSIHSHFLSCCHLKVYSALLPTTGYIYQLPIHPISFCQYVPIAPGKCCFNKLWKREWKASQGISGTFFEPSYFSRTPLVSERIFYDTLAEAILKVFHGTYQGSSRLHCSRCQRIGVAHEQSISTWWFQWWGACFPITCHLVHPEKGWRNRKLSNVRSCPSRFFILHSSTAPNAFL